MKSASDRFGRRTPSTTGQRHLAARVVRVDLDIVVVDRIGGQQRDDAVGLEPVALDQLREHALAVGEHLPGRIADDLVLEDRRVGTGQIPGLEERTPVDIVDQIAEIVVLEDAPSEHLRLDRREAGPVDPVLVLARLGERDHRHGLAVRMLMADPFVVGLDFFEVARRALVGQQVRRDRD